MQPVEAMTTTHVNDKATTSVPSSLSSSKQATPEPDKNHNGAYDDDGSEDDNHLRSGFKKVPLGETKERSTNRSVEARRRKSGLNRSSTAEILKLIKTKSRADFGKSMETVDEETEIEFLLNELQKEGVENIDWDEIGVDEKEVKNIVDKNRDDDEGEEEDEDSKSAGKDETSESSEESSESEDDSDQESDDDDEDEDEDEMKHTIFTNNAAISSLVDTKKAEPNKPLTSKACITLQPNKNIVSKLVVEEEDEEDEEDEEESSEEETDSD